MSTTSYDRVSSTMIAVCLALIIAVIWLGVIWATNRIPKPPDAVPIELLDLGGGVEDGEPDETLELESPEPETDDPSLAEEVSEETEISEMLDNVVELSDQASEQVQQQFETAAMNTGKPGSASGTGRRPLGSGSGAPGFPREQRWFIRFSDQGTLNEYTGQLDFFGIEMGVLKTSGSIQYLSNLSAARPAVRSANSGKGENRMYMTWRGGNRKQGDLKIFKKAGVDVGSNLILHFYPPKTEAMLADLEMKYRNRKPEEIRRTYFVVQGSPGNYTFVVNKQSYFR
ncbi:MAG: hypothetical protein CMJ78_15235 [Planctomycetaceae bacterium]|nr:hypothetical protein [Planctomycetaceae bacterium]